MKTLIIATLFVACIFARSESEEWTQFKQTYNKAYSKVEEAARFKIFSENLRTIRSHDEKKSYTIGVNAYADLTHEEFKARFNLDNLMDISVVENRERKTFVGHSSDDLPASLDWVKEGAVTEVKDQGQCQSCWAFSTIGSMEGAYFLKTKKLLSLSEQQLIECDTNREYGCKGGNMVYALEYLEKHHAELESDYQYTATDYALCKAKSYKAAVPTVNTIITPYSDLESVTQSLVKYGPHSIAIDASLKSFHLYTGGIFNEPECSSYNLGHGVLLVGYGTESGTDYWLIKNSWSKGWGMDGYVKIIRSEDNICGVLTFASAPVYNDE